MAVAAEALAPEVETAASGLSSEAKSAVSAASAGRGKRLTPEVAKELRKVAGKAAKTKIAAKVIRKGSSPTKTTPAPAASVARPVTRAAGAIVTQGGKAISGGNPGMLPRIIFAFGAFILALELASYLSGRYFTYNLGQGVRKIQTAGQHIGFYPGQTQKIAAQTAAAHVAIPGYAGTGAL